MPDAPETTPERAVRRALVRIEDEMEAIREQGLESPDLWYAKDRFAVIAEIATAASLGDASACCIGTAANPEHFDRAEP